MTTIVSFCYSITDKREERSIDNFIHYGKSLLKCNVPKVIFVDKLMYEKIADYENENTRILLSEKEDNYIYEYVDKVDQFHLNNPNVIKDTVDYMLLMAIKTEMVKKAAELNYFQTENFTWVDFGIKHMCNCNDKQFINKLEELNNKVYRGRVRIASIWNPMVDIRRFNIDIYKEVAWYFAGSIFGGNKEALLTFAERSKEMSINIIREKKSIMWEVNVWYLVYLQNRDLFDYYFCNHDNTIIDNY